MNGWTPEEEHRRAMLAEAINYAQDQRARWAAIAAFYRGIWPVVKRTPKHRFAFDHHEVNFVANMTPIELDVWSEMREEGVVLYPQHPVGRYFVDFGHPVAKVAIECDGREWHKDVAKDLERQKAIQAYGWRVYRLSGSACHRQCRPYFDAEGEEVFDESPATRLVRDLGQRFGLAGRWAMDERVVQPAPIELAKAAA